MKISEILKGHVVPAHEDSIGVEIECEGRNFPEQINQFWRIEPDGSLRNGIEFVTNKPMEYTYFPKALNQLNNKFEAAGTKLDFSFRTSVHVHVNCLNMEYEQLLAFIYTSLLLDSTLVDFCGEGRKANRFCLRMQDADGILEAIKGLFRWAPGKGIFGRIERDAYRYASLNIEALNKYGTLEFRAMRGNNDPEILIPWINTLIHIKHFAMKHGSPKAVFNLLEEKGPEWFLNEALGEHANLFITENSVENLNYDSCLSIDLPYIKKRPEYNIPGNATFSFRGEGPYTFEFLNDHFRGNIPQEHLADIIQQWEERLEMQKQPAIPQPKPAKPRINLILDEFYEHEDFEEI